MAQKLATRRKVCQLALEKLFKGLFAIKRQEFLTVHEDADILAACLSVGGLGYVIKVFMNNDLIPAMNAALRGRVFVSRFS